MRLGLSFRYWVVVAGLVTGFLTVGGAIEAYSAFQENKRRIAALQRAEALIVAVSVDNELKSIERALLDAASMPWREGLLSLADARDEFHRLVKVIQPIAVVRAYDGAGRRVVVSAKDPDELPHDSAAPIEPVLGPERDKAEIRYGPIELQRKSEPFSTVTIVPKGPQRFITRVEADLNLKFVSDVIGRLPAGQARIAYVIDANGFVIAHSNPAEALKGSQLSGLTHVSELRAAGARGESGVTGVESTDLRGAKVVASGMPIATARWSAFVEEPYEHATREAWATAWRTIFLVLAGLGAAVLASFLLARKLSRPIVEVRRGAERIARGDFGARISVQTGDEVEALASEFNRMAEQLQDYTTGLERKVEEKTAKLQEAMRARALFLAAASHDLRQPLYAISILADTLALKDMPLDARSTLTKQREAIAVLRGLFDNLLDLSRFDSGDIRVAPRVVPLREILASVAMEHEVVSRAKGLEWHCEVADVQVRTDPELVRRIMSNLLSNAVRYTTRGTVSLRAIEDGPCVKLEVVDTGVGIPPELQSRVFEEFVQLDNPSRERDRGVGLGLSIVKKIDGLLGTKLRLHSVPGEGTRVTFEIPMAEAGAEATDAVPTLEVTPVELAGLRVWIVEDDLMVRDALASQFAAWGVDYAFAATRDEVAALRAADEGWPDAAILDDMLGQGERGLEIAHWLEAHLPRSRILLATGNVDPEEARKLEASGFKVLRKPLSSVVLARWLQDAALPGAAVRSTRVDAPAR
jgi:signal transduction histidine kinase